MAFVVAGFLIGITYGCSSLRAPLVIRSDLNGAAIPENGSSSATWALDSLRPGENTVLTDGQTIPISIDLAAVGDGIYLVQLSANGKPFRPFKLTMVKGPGQIQFSGRITWFPKIRGKSETIIVGLYRVEEIRSGKTEVTSLLKQFKRSYDVVCNEQACAITVFLKKHLFCSCKPPS